MTTIGGVAWHFSIATNRCCNLLCLHVIDIFSCIVLTELCILLISGAPLEWSAVACNATVLLFLARTWDKDRILIHRKKSNLRPLVSALRCFTTEPQRLYGETGHAGLSDVQAWVTCVFRTTRNINVKSVMCVNFRSMIYFELDKVLLGTQVVFFVPCGPDETKNHISLNQIAYLALVICWYARATSFIFFPKQAYPPPTVYEVKRSISSLTWLICLSELFPTLKIQSWIWNEKNRM